MKTQLNLLSLENYHGVNRDDPIRFYYWPLIGRFYRKRVEMCLDECRGGDRVLEVGFGSGLSFLNLNEKYSAIYGIDLSVNVLQVLNTFQGMNLPLNLQNGNVLQMPFQDNYFDTILLISILEHLNPEDLSRGFSEINRVLKIGGQMIVGVPVERHFMEVMFRLMGVNIREHHFSTDRDVLGGAQKVMKEVCIRSLHIYLIGDLYKVGHFQK